MSSVGAAGSILKALNPIELAFDFGASLLNLPPEVKSAAKVAVGWATANPMMAASGALELVSNIAEKAATTEYAPSAEPAVASRGYAASSTGSKMSDLEQTEKHLMTLQKHLPVLDKVGAWFVFTANDGLFDAGSLKAIMQNPNVPSELREAARFFFQRPDSFALLDVAARVGHSDGRVGLADIESMLDNVRAQLTEKVPDANSDVQTRDLKGPKKSNAKVSSHKEPKSAAKTHSSGGGKEIRDILNDPTLSLEEKIQLILNALLDKIDKQIENTMDDLADAQDRAGATKDKRTDGNKSQYASEAKDDREVERVNQRLQKLMEQKKAMNDLLSNMTMKFAEMTKTAITNLARA